MIQNLGRLRVKVRADHLENGDIIPLGYIDQHGKTIRVDRVLLSRNGESIDNNISTSFFCRTGKTIVFLTYTNSGWFLS